MLTRTDISYLDVIASERMYPQPGYGLRFQRRPELVRVGSANADPLRLCARRNVRAQTHSGLSGYRLREPHTKLRLKTIISWNDIKRRRFVQ